MPNEKWIEHLALLSLTSESNKKIAKKLIVELSESFFPSSLYRTAFRRIQSVYNTRSHVLTWKELISDSTLEANVSSKLKALEVRRSKVVGHDQSLEIAKTFEEFQSLLVDLKVNSTHKDLISVENKLASSLNTGITKDTLDEIIGETLTTLENLKLRFTNKAKLFKIEQKAVRSRFKDFYSQLNSGFFVPTGFKGFDAINLGIPKDSFFLIAGKSGSGKSSLAIQLSLNFKRAGARVCVVPLEMSIEQNLLRFGSNLIGVPIVDIIKDFKRYYKPLVKAITAIVEDESDASCIHFYEPEIDETLDKTLAILAEHEYDVIFIDYINLMAQMGGDTVSQAYALNLASRYAKRWATSNKTIVCFLAQLDDDENRVRYARALQEDASNFWLWNQTSAEIGELGYVEILQRKARNQNPKPFKLKVDLSCSKYTDYIEEDTVGSKKVLTDKLDLPDEDEV